jgi:anti-sigma factor RsiW
MTQDLDSRAVGELDCRATVLRLWDYLDEELDSARRLEVDEHIRHCNACAEHFGFARAFLNMLPDSWPSVVETDDLRRRVVTRLESEGFRLS